MEPDELLCCKCIVEYASKKVDKAPRSATTIYLGQALCWIHFADRAGISELLDIKVDDFHYPTGYAVIRKQEGQQQRLESEEDDEEKNKREWKKLLESRSNSPGPSSSGNG